MGHLESGDASSVAMAARAEAEEVGGDDGAVVLLLVFFLPPWTARAWFLSSSACPLPAAVLAPLGPPSRRRTRNFIRVGAIT